jgi:hypothetical protein
VTCRAPRVGLHPLLEIWPAGTLLHVVHDAAYPPESFNPGVDAAGVPRWPTRFAPIRDVAGQVVPYLYAGSTLDCAIFETVFHNVPVDASDKFVDLDDAAHRSHGTLSPSRDLALVDLSTDGLHRLRVPKAELIGSAPMDYLATAAWAQALHRHRRSDLDVTPAGPGSGGRAVRGSGACGGSGRAAPWAAIAAQRHLAPNRAGAGTARRHRGRLIRPHQRPSSRAQPPCASHRRASATHSAAPCGISPSLKS